MGAAGSGKRNAGRSKRGLGEAAELQWSSWQLSAGRLEKDGGQGWQAAKGELPLLWGLSPSPAAHSPSRLAACFRH